MKTSIIALAALVSGAVAIDKPHFLNSDINPEEGTPFTFKYDNCPDGCTIILQSGSDQKNLQTITSSATGSSFTWTPSNIPSGTYNFYIQNNSDKSLNNYSAKFQYQGTATSTASASSTPSSTSGSSSSTAASSSSASSTASSSSSASTTKSHSSTSAAAASSSATKSAAAATTTAPGNAGNAVSFSPIALIGGAVAAMLFLN